MYLGGWSFWKWQHITKRQIDVGIPEPEKQRDDNAEAKFLSVVKGLKWHAFKRDK